MNQQQQMAKPLSTQQKNIGPWPNLAMARNFLNILVDYPVNQDISISGLAADSEQLTLWLTHQALGPLAYAAVGSSWPGLTRALQTDVYSAMAENDLHLLSIDKIGQLFSQADIPFIWLKGSALAHSIYPESWQRLMSDVDVWLPPDLMRRAVIILEEAGYQIRGSQNERPFELQKLSYGEVKMTPPNRRWGLVELHYGPLAGWWIVRSTEVDYEGMWRRKVSLPGMVGGYQLEANDMVLQVVVHLSVNHHFCTGALRNLIDIARLAKRRQVDWVVVAERAKEWRVETAVYTVLSLLDNLIGVEGLDAALKPLRPASWRRRAIRRFVTPESVLAGRDVSTGWQRFLLLLLLVDRKRDMVKLVWRTLWPERVWLKARYGDDTGHWKHLWRVVRNRNV